MTRLKISPPKQHHTINPCLRFVLISFICIIALFFSSGCAMIMSSATSDMMTHLSGTISNNDDLEMVQSGAPAYLLMIDSLIAKDPENEKMLIAAANLYASYADLFVTNTLRSQKMADKALNYANTAICLLKTEACSLKTIPYEDFQAILSRMEKNQVPALFALGNAWARWIMVNKHDFNAIADLSRIELIMERIIVLDETYQDGAAYLYLGTLSSLLPPALGGKPEKGKAFFEKALLLSREKNLMVKVLYAKFYARMMFDRALHDQLLSQVLAADPYVPGYTLINTLAQKQANDLMLSADDYF
ncbi:MAG: TRAP transporter TatT component family protein [Pseudomonadota bacterium]